VLPPSQRRLRAQIAANIGWSETPDRTARTAPGRQAAEERFFQLVDPDGTLDPAERARRAANARRAHFQRMAFKSAEARRRKAATITQPIETRRAAS
jgi:hypothetical protein